MLDVETRRILNFRIRLVEAALKSCNSGAEVHEVGNMRNVASLLKSRVYDYDVKRDDVLPILERLEKQATEFFRKKYDNGR